MGKVSALIFLTSNNNFLIHPKIDFFREAKIFFTTIEIFQNFLHSFCTFMPRYLRNQLSNKDFSTIINTFRQSFREISDCKLKNLHFFFDFSFTFFSPNLHKNRKISFSLWRETPELSINQTFWTLEVQWIELNLFSCSQIRLICDRSEQNAIRNRKKKSCVMSTESIFFIVFDPLRMMQQTFSLPLFLIEIYQNKPTKTMLDLFNVSFFNVSELRKH